MKAVVLHRPGLLELVDQAEPAALEADDVLVATRRVGLCGTDYHAYARAQNLFTYPRVLGHELAVEVLEVGSDVEHVRVGDSCAVLPYVACGTCFACRRQRSNCCEHLVVLGVTIDGGLRERFVVPATALYSRPGLDLDALALVETLAVGFHAVERSGAGPEQLALVVGAGPVGLAVGQALLARGSRVAMMDISEQRVDGAADLLAVDGLPTGEHGEQRLRELGQGALPSLVFDATGNRQSMEASLGLVNFSGSLVLVGHTTGPVAFDNPTLHRREISIIASRNARPADWSQVFALVESGQLDATPWINGRTTLDNVPEQLDEWSRPGSSILKGIVEVTS